MKEIPKLKRGRPTKAMQARIDRIKKENALEAATTPDEREAIELDLILDRQTYEVRQTALQPTEDVLRVVFLLAKIKATQGEIAAALGVPRRTFGYFMDQNPVARETYEAGRAFYDMRLRRQQIAMANRQPSMAIFLGKNDLGQKDIHEVKNSSGKDAAATMSNDDLMKIIKDGGSIDPKKAEGKPLQ